MKECIAEELCRKSGKIELVKALKFQLPADFDLSGQIAALRKEDSGIFLDEEITDLSIMEADDSLIPGEEYDLSIYSAKSVTSMGCYCWLEEERALCLGGSGVIAVWSLLKGELLDAVGSQKNAMVSTAVLSFSKWDSLIVLWRFNRGKDSFWKLNCGPFDDDGFYFDAYLLAFKRA
jgi:hypothetical protein